jgi:hypothetical protein
MTSRERGKALTPCFDASPAAAVVGRARFD